MVHQGAAKSISLNTTAGVYWLSPSLVFWRCSSSNFSLSAPSSAQTFCLSSTEAATGSGRETQRSGARRGQVTFAWLESLLFLGGITSAPPPPPPPPLRLRLRLRLLRASGCCSAPRGSSIRNPPPAAQRASPARREARSGCTSLQTWEAFTDAAARSGCSR